MTELSTGSGVVLYSITSSGGLVPVIVKGFTTVHMVAADLSVFASNRVVLSAFHVMHVGMGLCLRPYRTLTVILSAVLSLLMFHHR